MSLSLPLIAGWTRFIRSSMLDVVRQNYFGSARKGLGPRTVV